MIPLHASKALICLFHCVAHGRCPKSLVAFLVQLNPPSYLVRLFKCEKSPRLQTPSFGFRAISLVQHWWIYFHPPQHFGSLGIIHPCPSYHPVIIRWPRYAVLVIILTWLLITSSLLFINWGIVRTAWAPIDSATPNYTAYVNSFWNAYKIEPVKTCENKH